jgi:RNase H-like domain found in reverse transcriptase/Reverse transcriptase (RNA-dependent DNA polymerase)/Integrase zinc binding domain
VGRKGRLPIFTLPEWGGARVLVDTGSTSTIAGRKIAERMGWLRTAQGCSCRMTTVVGSQAMGGEFKLNLKGLTGRKGAMTVHIADIPEGSYNVILGTDVLRPYKGYSRYKRGYWRIKIGDRSYRAEGCVDEGEHLGVTLVRGSEEKELSKEEKDLVSSFEKVTYKEGERLTATGRVEHNIDLIGERPVYVKPRRYPKAYEEVIKKQIGEMLETGVIQPSTSPFCSPLWVVPKPPDAEGNPRYRVVVDYRELNKRTKTEKYPLPRLEEMLDRMAGATVFSTLDLKAGYHQIRMCERDKEKTAFQFGRGKFEFVRMPFGLKNAPSTFQRLMDEFLLGLDEQVVQAYMDDIIVFSRTRKEHQTHLKQVLERLREFKLRISGEKSSFFKSEVKFMGHIVSKEGVRPNKEKVAAIKDIPIPKNQKDIRAFLGVVNYYRRFLGNMAGHVEPLNRLLKKNIKFEISPEVEASIAWCKEKLSTAPILQFPDFRREFVVTTDASQVAIGAVLSQEGELGDRPVAFASRRLSPAETRYSTIERELLGVVWAVQYFRPYLLGRKFRIRTDHKPLVWVDKLKETSARISRWKETLAAYDFEITHTKGVDNVVADCLSRQVNAIEEEVGTPEPFAVRYLRELAEVGPDETPEETLVRTYEEDADREREHRETPAGEPRVLEEVRSIINNKRRQIVITRLEGSGVGTQAKRYRHLSMVWVAVGREASEEDILGTLNQIIEPGRVFHVFTASQDMRDKLGTWYRERRVAGESTLVLCTRRVETIEEEPRQLEIVHEYHIGKTNHRGIGETLTHLGKSYYWVDMPRTIREVIRACAVCNRAKYERAPAEAPLMQTETPKEPLELVQADIMFWGGLKVLTMLDLATRFLFAKCLSRKTGQAVREGLLAFVGTVGGFRN